MSTENFHVLALPYSVRPVVEEEDDFHVSLFISPHLVPNGTEEPLSDFALFPAWAAHLAESLEIRLEDQHGTIEGVRPLLGKVDPTFWHELFPGSTPVRANRVPDWRKRGWRSFDAGLVADIAKLLHITTITTSLTETPSPVRHFGGRTVSNYPDKSLVIRTDSARDREVEARTPGEWLDRGRSSGGDFWDSICEQLHRARRFYERPEEQMAYREHPDPDFPSAPLDSPAPEFHERCAMAGDHPTLLRRLGLVIDLQVMDLERLANATFLVATISVGGRSTACVTHRVRCHANADGSFTTVSSSGDWVDGALAVGEEDRFSVIDVDPDGSALKTERYLGVLPQLVRVALNGDPATAATPALRAGGFTIARRNRAYYTQVQIGRQLEIEGGTKHDLVSEDVARGMRVEVWDDEVATWRSLHERVSEIVVGSTSLPTTDPGFVQGAAAAESVGVPDSKIHLHEALAGWEGWSLSVERPGKRIRYTHGDPAEASAVRREVVEDTPDHPILGERPPHPVRATHAVAPASLPRLRFGRDYAFRAWLVDLAGNSRPHELNPGVQPNLAPVLPRTPGLLEQVVTLQPDLTAQIRQAAAVAQVADRLAPDTVAGEVEAHPALAEALRNRAGGQTGPTAAGDRLRRFPATTVTRRSLVDTAAARVIENADHPLVLDVTVRSPERLADLVSSHAAAIGALEVTGSLAGAAVQALKTVTKLRPFLRWDPVLAPVVVPLKKYTEGESQRVVVIRSGVSQDQHTLAITVTDPAAYAAQANAAVQDLAYQGVSSRHLVPPKTSQMIAELHGKFDLAIGTADAAKNQQMLTWALIEDGSLLDADRGSLTDPVLRTAQPGRALVRQSDRSTAQPPDALPGDPLGQGEYVVHDTPELTLPYLPDPLAVGISLVFPEAGRHGISGPEGVEGFTAGYRGTWPAVEPLRMDLLGSDVLGADVVGRVLGLRLPPSDVQRFRLSSSLRSEDLHELGVWRHLNPALTGDPDVAEAAKDGWIWGLTPAEDVTVLHAVPRPLEAPRPTLVSAHRQPGSNAAYLRGVLDVHGASTDSVIGEAAWTDPTDELDKPGPGTVEARGTAFQLRIGAAEDLLALDRVDGAVGWELESLKVHAAVHQIGDTKHHEVTYTLRASTRFREYFHPELLKPAYPGDDGRSVVSAPLTLSVPSSAPPAPPIVHSTIPLFRWDTGTEAEQPMGWQHERKVGVRIYLERPWYSSGDGELLGILLAEDTDEFGPPSADDSGFPYVSKIGADPIWEHREVEHRALSLLHLDNSLHLIGMDDRVEPGRPVKVQQATVRSGSQSFQVVVAGYKPSYNAERKLWYVDVAIDPWAGLEHPTTAFWPFLRLAVARFQPDSVANCHLSAPVRCDYVQLPPERTTNVSRTDEQHVRVVVSGTRGLRDANRFGDQNRIVVAALQKKDPRVPTDLGWNTVDSAILPIRSDPEQWEVSWMGELDAGKPFSLRRPEPSAGGPPVASRWRVTIEEWEQFEGDPVGDEPTWERRLVYADSVLL